MEEILGVYPASEIWGINRKAPCHIVVSDERLAVVKGGSRRRSRRLMRSALGDDGIEQVMEAAHYTLPYGSVRWVDLRHFLTHSLLKIGTPGGTYRFRVGRRTARRIRGPLRDLLGDLVREKPVRPAPAPSDA